MKHDISPGPIYETAEIGSIHQKMRTLKEKRSRYATLPGREEQKVLYSGQDQHFVGRLGKGPGCYEPERAFRQKTFEKQGNSPLGRSDRGLLTLKKDRSPGPGSYDNNTIKLKQSDAQWSIPRRPRDNFFAKFTS